MQVVKGSGSVIVMSAASAAKSGEQVTVDKKIYTKGENIFGTISEALAKVTSGGTITLKDNVYNGSYVISKPVTIEGDGMVTVNGTFECAVKDVVFKDLIITYNRTSAGESAIVLRDGITESSVSVKGCKLVDVGKGTAGAAVKSNNKAAANSGGSGGGSSARKPVDTGKVTSDDVQSEKTEVTE